MKVYLEPGEDRKRLSNTATVWTRVLCRWRLDSRGDQQNGKDKVGRRYPQEPPNSDGDVQIAVEQFLGVKHRNFHNEGIGIYPAPGPSVFGLDNMAPS